MPIKNSIAVGALVGLILPLLAYFFSDVFLKEEIIPAKPGVLYLIAIGINLILLKFIAKSNTDKAATGLLIVTFIVLLLAFIFKIKLR